MSLEPNGILKYAFPNHLLSTVYSAHSRLCLISDLQSQFPFKVSFIRATNIYPRPGDTSLWAGYWDHVVPALEEPMFR